MMSAKSRRNSRTLASTANPSCPKSKDENRTADTPSRIPRTRIALFFASATTGRKPTGGAGVTGTLGTITDPNGKPMVTYNGWPVYFYAKDKSPGDTTGQNVGQKWFVVTPDLTPNA